MAEAPARRGLFGMPTDEAATKTLFRGMALGAAGYLVGAILPLVLKAPVWQWVGLVITGLSVAFVVGWFVAVKRGFRVGQLTRAEKRAKEKQREEREKKRRYQMRRM